jgi:hypothetical protein
MQMSKVPIISGYEEFGHQAGCSPLPPPQTQNEIMPQLFPSHNDKFGRLLKLFNIIRF